MTFQFLMVVVDGFIEALKVSPRDRVLQRFRGADHVDTPVPQGRGGFGGPQGFLPSSATASSSHSPGAVDEAFAGVFSHFSPNSKKKARGWARTRGRNWVRDFNPWTPAPYAGSMVLEEDELGMESESES